MRLWLARHARPLVAPGTCYGAGEVMADAAHTLESAALLAQVLPPALPVRTSPRLRCTALADALAQLRPDLHPAPDARLAEMDFGSWEGRSWDAIGQAAIDTWTADFARHRCGGGESVSDLLARVAQALAEACDGRRDMLWITHAGVARAVRVLTAPPMALDAAAWPREGPAFGAVECTTLDAQRLRASLRENAHARGCP
ncbi:MAG TPA: histidine phosphatase family protein [Ramlibacter sp.]